MSVSEPTSISSAVSYREEMTRAMRLLSRDPRVFFLGQNTIFGGAIAIHESLEGIDHERILETPVAEDLQLGMSLGLALAGLVPVSIFPRMDFLMRAMDQLVNHLDKLDEMSMGRFRPRLIVRTGVGASYPLHPGPQHIQDHTEALRLMLTNIDVVRLEEAKQIVPAYVRALESPRSTILVELGERMRT